MGKYIKLFDTHTDYGTYISDIDAILPNVSYCENNDHVHYNPYASFGFLSKEKKKVTIPYVNGLTSQSFLNKIPSSSWYLGFIQEPIDITQTDGKTNDEIDALFPTLSRTTIAKTQINLEYGKMYKIITYGKEYMSNCNIILVNNNPDKILFPASPINLFRKCGIILNETSIQGVTMSTFTYNDVTYNSQDLFGIEGYMCVVDVSNITFEQNVEYTITPFYRTYDYVDIIGDVIRTYTI